MHNIEEVYPFVTLQPRTCLCYTFDLLPWRQKRCDLHYSDTERSCDQNLFYYDMADHCRPPKQWSLAEHETITSFGD